MLKRIGTYFAFTAVGALLGYFIFGYSSNNMNTSQEIIENSHGKWTCSMHPQIDGKENGNCPLCAMDLVFVDDALAEVSADQFKMSNDALALANVHTTKVGYANTGETSLRLSGAITTNKEKDAIQTTLFDGRVDQLYISSIGKKVRKGQEIGLVYSPELYLAQDKLLTSASYKQTHQKLYDAARNTLGLWKLTDEQIDAMLANGKPIMNFPLYADVTGTVVEVMANEGNYYSKGDALYRTSDLRTLWAVFDAYESQLNFLKVGQKIELSLPSLPGEKIKAKISFVEPILDKEKRTVSVRVVINNQKGLFKPGMFVEAEVQVDTFEEQVITVPKSAVLWTGKRSIVYKKPFNEQPIFELTEVELGRSLGDYYEVLRGLDFGDVLVTEGAFTIDAAAQLSGKKSMMSNKNEDHEMHGHDNMDMDLKDIPQKIDISMDFEMGFEDVLKDYVLLKDALVATDSDQAKKYAKSFLDKLVKNTSLSSSKIVQLNDISLRLKRIESFMDIEKQRKEFKYLSQSMLTILPSIKDFELPVYVQHCDCADGFKGGSWLSLNENILNPYFGDTMLTCGRVEQVLN